MLRAISSVLLVVTQAAGSTPIRLGDVARQFSTSDIAGMSRAAGDVGSVPWLLASDLSQLAGTQSVIVFLAPQTTTALVRRGTTLHLDRGQLAPFKPNAPATAAVSGDWVVRETQSWTQVRVGDR